MFIVQRMDGQWTFTGTIQSSDPEQNGDFGSAVALAGDRLDYVIGEPRATVEGITEGRAHFVNAVSAPYDFDIQPAGSAITVTIRFMGQPVTIEISPAGDLVGLVMDSCEGSGSFLLTEVTLTNTADHVAFEIPPQVPAPWGGSEVILSNLQVRIAEIGAAATLDDQGMGTLAGYRLDVGLGDFNPTLGVQASIGAKNPAPPQRLSISAYGKEAAGFRVEVSGAAGLAVVVEACSDLSASEWTPVSSVTLTDEPLAVIDSDSTPHAARFYRVRSP